MTEVEDGWRREGESSGKNIRKAVAVTWVRVTVRAGAETDGHGEKWIDCRDGEGLQWIH